MTQWFEAYSKWPPNNQLIFSVIAIIAGAVLLFLGGVWTTQFVRNLVILVRGWPTGKPEVRLHRPRTQEDAAQSL